MAVRQQLFLPEYIIYIKEKHKMSQATPYIKQMINHLLGTDENSKELAAQAGREAIRLKSAETLAQLQANAPVQDKKE